MTEQLSFFDRAWKRLNLNRASRMKQHYDAIRHEIVPRTKREKEECIYFSGKFRKYYKRTIRLYHYRFLTYLFLYASIIVNLLKAIPFLSFLVDFIQFGNALAGTTVLIVLIFWLTTKINLHVELMNESLTHLIAMYHHNGKRDTKRTLRRLDKTL